MKLLKSLLKVFDTIAEGMSYINLYPFHSYRMPIMTDEEALAHDRKMIERDWAVVMNDWNTVVKRHNLTHLIHDTGLYEK